MAQTNRDTLDEILSIWFESTVVELQLTRFPIERVKKVHRELLDTARRLVRDSKAKELPAYEASELACEAKEYRDAAWYCMLEIQKDKSFKRRQSELQI